MGGRRGGRSRPTQPKGRRISSNDSEDEYRGQLRSGGFQEKQRVQPKRNAKKERIFPKDFAGVESSLSSSTNCEKPQISLISSLSRFGLSIKQMKADGNCLFRAFADQISGDSEAHMREREMAIEYLHEHRAEYECFIEDDEPFTSYCKRIAKEGVWGGQLELHILSMMHKVNVLVHQHDGPSWEMRNFPEDRDCIQLSYHDGEHYNSVRSSDQMQGVPTRMSLRELKALTGPLRLNETNETEERTEEEETEKIEELLRLANSEDWELAKLSLQEAENNNGDDALEIFLSKQFDVPQSNDSVSAVRHFPQEGNVKDASFCSSPIISSFSSSSSSSAVSSSSRGRDISSVCRGEKTAVMSRASCGITSGRLAEMTFSSVDNSSKLHIGGRKGHEKSMDSFAWSTPEDNAASSSFSSSSPLLKCVEEENIEEIIGTGSSASESRRSYRHHHRRNRGENRESVGEREGGSRRRLKDNYSCNYECGDFSSVYGRNDDEDETKKGKCNWDERRRSTISSSSSEEESWSDSTSTDYKEDENVGSVYCIRPSHRTCCAARLHSTPAFAEAHPFARLYTYVHPFTHVYRQQKNFVASPPTSWTMEEKWAAVPASSHFPVRQTEKREDSWMEEKKGESCEWKTTSDEVERERKEGRTQNDRDDEAERRRREKKEKEKFEEINRCNYDMMNVDYLLPYVISVAAHKKTLSSFSSSSSSSLSSSSSRNNKIVDLSTPCCHMVVQEESTAAVFNSNPSIVSSSPSHSNRTYFYWVNIPSELPRSQSSPTSPKISFSSSELPSSSSSISRQSSSSSSSPFFSSSPSSPSRSAVLAAAFSATSSSSSCCSEEMVLSSPSSPLSSSLSSSLSVFSASSENGKVEQSVMRRAEKEENIFVTSDKNWTSDRSEKYTSWLTRETEEICSSSSSSERRTSSDICGNLADVYGDDSVVQENTNDDSKRIKDSSCISIVDSTSNDGRSNSNSTDWNTHEDGAAECSESRSNSGGGSSSSKNDLGCWFGNHSSSSDTRARSSSTIRSSNTNNDTSVSSSTVSSNSNNDPSASSSSCSGIGSNEGVSPDSSRVMTSSLDGGSSFPFSSSLSSSSSSLSVCDSPTLFVPSSCASSGSSWASSSSSSSYSIFSHSTAYAPPLSTFQFTYGTPSSLSSSHHRQQRTSSLPPPHIYLHNHPYFDPYYHYNDYTPPPYSLPPFYPSSSCHSHTKRSRCSSISRSSSSSRPDIVSPSSESANVVNPYASIDISSPASFPFCVPYPPPSSYQSPSYFASPYHHTCDGYSFPSLSLWPIPTRSRSPRKPRAKLPRISNRQPLSLRLRRSAQMKPRDLSSERRREVVVNGEGESTSSMSRRGANEPLENLSTLQEENAKLAETTTVGEEVKEEAAAAAAAAVNVKGRKRMTKKMRAEAKKAKKLQKELNKVEKRRLMMAQSQAQRPSTTTITMKGRNDEDSSQTILSGNSAAPPLNSLAARIISV